ncbi:hypothetical protein AC1031_001136 [Aphanomyces cochlioides]|nr:hypothetical protein AC1031_001136 [Aphanomyces cochlioides]
MMATTKENTPHVQRKLTFQGLSIKQEEAQFNANRVVSSRPDATKNPTPISSKKTSSSKRRALGDISNNTSASLDKKAQPAFRTPLKFTDGTSQSSTKNVEASAAVELASKLSLKVHSEDVLSWSHRVVLMVSLGHRKCLWRSPRVGQYAPSRRSSKTSRP